MNGVANMMICLDEKPQNHENALVGLSLIGRRLEEEKVVAMLGVMKDVLGDGH